MRSPHLLATAASLVAALSLSGCIVAPDGPRHARYENRDHVVVELRDGHDRSGFRCDDRDHERDRYHDEDCRAHAR